jgi:hypothetical protein
MQFKALGNRKSEGDYFTFRCQLSEKDVRFALAFAREHYNDSVGWGKDRIREILADSICYVCKMQLSDIWKGFVGEWAFRLAIRHELIFGSGYTGEFLYYPNDSKKFIRSRSKVKVGETVAE